MQEVKYKGKIHQVLYKDPRLMLFDKAVTRKIFEQENPYVNYEKAMKVEEELLKSSQDAVVTDNAQVQQKRKRKAPAKKLRLEKRSQCHIR